MIEIKVNMNSDVEDVLAFKTCCSLQAQDMNLEILVTNHGLAPVEMPSHFDLHTDQGAKRISSVVPAGGIRIAPGEVKAIYCQMDEVLWTSASGIVLFDSAGGEFPAEID